MLIALKMVCEWGLQNQSPAGHVLPTPLCLWYRLLHMAPAGDGKPFKGPISTIRECDVKGELRTERPKFKASTPQKNITIIFCA